MGSPSTPERPLWRAKHDKRAADSAGTPWVGRQLSPQPFANDKGTTPRAYTLAIAALRTGSGKGPAEALDVLRTTRLLIPLIAERSEEGVTATGQVVDKQADLSIVSVAGPDGRKTLPVFTSVAAMRVWDATARPVPVESQRAAIAAVDDDAQLMIVDPGSATEFGLRRPMVWSLAQGTPWTVPWQDAAVIQRIDAIVQAECARAGVPVVEVQVVPVADAGDLEGPETGVHVRVAAPASASAPVPASASAPASASHSATAPAPTDLSQRIQAALAADADLVSRVDSLVLRVDAASEFATGGARPSARQRATKGPITRAFGAVFGPRRSS